MSCDIEEEGHDAWVYPQFLLNKFRPQVSFTHREEYHKEFFNEISQKNVILYENKINRSEINRLIGIKQYNHLK